MEVRFPGRRTVVVHAFPSGDVVFATEVDEAIQRARSLTEDPVSLRALALERLARHYPNTRIVEAEPFGQVLPDRASWYVYRDRAIRPPSETREHLYDLLADARETVAGSEAAMRRSDAVAAKAGYPARPAHDSAGPDRADRQ